jgi:hypothetical protein
MIITNGENWNIVLYQAAYQLDVPPLKKLPIRTAHVGHIENITCWGQFQTDNVNYTGITAKLIVHKHKI